MASQQIGVSEGDGSPIPEDNDSNDLSTNKNVKSDRSRRIWSVREEEILMATLKELAANGWKSDNRFCACYLVRAREAIKREFSKTDILPNPHIYSKITTWKRNHGSLMMMLNHCGIGFNSNGDYKIECDDEHCAQFVKAAANYTFVVDFNLGNKSWPQIEDWKEIFGKDRADGEWGIDVGATVGKIYGEKDDLPDDAGTSHPMTFKELFPDEVFPDGVLPEMVDESQSVTEGSVGGAGGVAGAGFGARPGQGAVAGAVSGSGSGAGMKMQKKVLKKRKIDDKMDGVLTLMGQIHTDTNERLKEISSTIGYEFDLSTKRTEVFIQLKGIPRLTLKQQLYISKKLVKEPELLDLFRGLPEAARAAFFFDLLEIDGML
ncbi:hypothetical protein SASPL_152575 [Salvia splendens]|uniref:Myb/SANT-like domain-containing protein n=1 Tax=Salvia splendens TaxID=180675 RepID=A0A8X8Z0Y9_SALSN|nr:hypothetical protein SASPL_152575 [Salvia splendens]